jgi:ubiquinol-cytochrome c reductase cytochrome c subunit
MSASEEERPAEESDRADTSAAVEDTGDVAGSAPPVRRRLRRPALRRFTGFLVLAGALFATGVVYAAFAPPSAADEASTASVREGKTLYDVGCITCHGRNGEGVDGRGPSLVGVGSAAVEYQVGTGRMPLAQQGADARQKPPVYTEDEIRRLGAYVQSLGGGPQVPTGDLRDGDLSLGGRLYRVNCSSCHGFSMNGNVLSSGKQIPALHASDNQIYAAMQSGPGSMPRFGDNQLTPDEKRAIINYVQTQKTNQDPGGFSLGRFGPVPEGLIIFLVGIGGLLFATLWIAGKS